MTKNQQVLRKVAKFLYCVAEGAPTTSADFKTFSDLCWLCVPNNQRMDKAEISEIKSHPWKAGAAESEGTATCFDEAINRAIENAVEEFTRGHAYPGNVRLKEIMAKHFRLELGR